MKLYSLLYEKEKDFPLEMSLILRSVLSSNVSFLNFFNRIKEMDTSLLKQRVLVTPPDETMAIQSRVEKIRVNDLIPIQSNLNVNKFLIPALRNEKSIISRGSSKKLIVFDQPIIVLDSKYIVDGHHRWAQSFIANPNGEILCTNIYGKESSVVRASDPLYLLKLIKLFSLIKGKPKKRPKENELDLFTISDIRDFIKLRLDSRIASFLYNFDSFSFEKIKENLSKQSEVTDFDVAVEIIFQRVTKIKKLLSTRIDSPREIMPDLSGIEEELVKNFSIGKINTRLYLE